MNIDFMNANGQGQGDVAQKLLSGITPDAMRPFFGKDGKSYISVFKGGDAKDPKNYSVIQTNTATTLRREEWISLDQAVVTASRSRLRGIQSLIDRGLVYNLGNGMGSTILESHKASDGFEAELSMDGKTRTKGDRSQYETVYLPLPIIHSDFDINARVLAASRTMGNPLDTTQVESATRRVAEKLENMLFTNTTYGFGGGTIYSYLNHPDRNTVNIDGWDGSGKTAAGIIADVMSMKSAAIADGYFGPYELYVPTAYETILDEDYNATTPGTTIRERILKISGIEKVTVVDALTAGNVILVQMTSDVVRLVNGMGMKTVQWSTEGGMVSHYKVMTIQVPQLRSDYNSKMGLVHAS